jgi:hypothetical protein
VSSFDSLSLRPLTPTVNHASQLTQKNDINNALDDGDNDEEYGEIPDRETIKKHTLQLLNAKLKSKQVKKVKKKRAGKEEDSA